MINRIGVTVPLLFGIIVLSIAGVSAQSLGTAKTESRSGTTVSDRILEDYLYLNSIPQEKRPEVFNGLSAEDKAGVFRFHYAFQLVKRPGLTRDQKELILAAIAGTRADSYDRNKPEGLAKAREASKIIEQKAVSLFSRKEAYEIFASLTANRSDADPVRKYLKITGCAQWTKGANCLTDRRPPIKAIIGEHILHTVSRDIPISTPISKR